MIKAVIFDVDGVLVDSRDANVALVQLLLKKAGHPVASREDILASFHLPLWQTLEKVTGISDQKEIERIWKLARDPAVRSERSNNLFMFPDKLESILEELHRTYRLGIVTSRIKVGLEEIFSITNTKRFFEVVVTYEDYTHPKPHPEPLHVAVQRFGIPVGEAVYIGDSHTDIQAAVAAGMTSIHLSPTKDAAATVGIAHFDQIVEAVRKLG